MFELHKQINEVASSKVEDAELCRQILLSLLEKAHILKDDTKEIYDISPKRLMELIKKHNIKFTKTEIEDIITELEENDPQRKETKNKQGYYNHIVTLLK
jgi:hypothetical protein